MKKFYVTINCAAVYNACIEVEDDATFDDAIEEAKMQLKDIPLGELEYVQGSDTLDEENCYFENEDEENYKYVVHFDEDGQNMDQWFYASEKEEAINYAKKNVEEGPVLYEIDENGIENAIEYFFDDEGDEDDKDENIDGEGLDDEQKKGVELWDKFDEKMREYGYSLVIHDADTQEEEIRQFGKICSPLGTTAVKDDRFAPFVKLYVSSDLKYLTINVIDRNGSAILEGRTIATYLVVSMSTDAFCNAIDEIIDKYGKYGTGNYVPHELCDSRKEI